MPVEPRTPPRLLIATLAVPVIVAAYMAFVGGRALSAVRTTLAIVLGAAVIGLVYAEETWRHTPAPARRAPLPTALAIALALVLAGNGVPGAQVQAAGAAESVVTAAMRHLNKPYVWGATGPNSFDCSGLIFRAFKEAGQLQLIGGKRTTALRYFRYHSTRGLASKTDGKRGDLVVYGGGAHIGIYLGKGKVLSAVAEGVKVHGLHALRGEFTAFLKVAWGAKGDPGSGGGGGSDDDPGATDTTETTDVTESTDASDVSGSADTKRDKRLRADRAVLPTGYAFGSLNMRSEPNPQARIIGWVTRGTTVTILGTGRSPSGALWLHVQRNNGREGWIWARWVRVVEGSLEDLSN